MDVSVKDLESVIRGEVKKAVADKMTAGIEQAAELGERAAKDGINLAARARQVDEHPRASVDASGQLRNDPHKGRGLNFARAVKALFATATMNLTAARDVAHKWAREGAAGYSEVADAFSAHERALLQGVPANGGSLIPPQFSSEIIELLYARTVALASGARPLEFVGSIGLGKINSSATTYYVGEAQNITPSQQGTGELRLTGKKASALVAVSNEMMRNPTVSADAIVRDDLLQAMALRRDLSALRGTGESGQPKGIGNWVNASNAFSSTGTTVAQKVADLVKMVRLVDESNIDLSSGGFVMSPRSKWALFATLDANSNFVFAAQLAAGMLLGFPVRTSTQIPNNLSGSNSEVYFGAWSDLIIGFDQVTPLSVEAFPNGTFYDGSALVSGISSDQTPIRVLEGHDVALRHDNTFAKLDSVAWT